MDPVLDLTVRSALVLLFLAAAVHKLRDLRGFWRILRAYRIVPRALVGAAGVCIALAELLVAGLVAIPATRMAGLVAAATLLGSYAAAVAVNLARGHRHIECGCGGRRTRQPISAGLAAQNVLLALVALATLVPVHPRALGWADGLAVVAAVALFRRLWL